MDVSDKLAFEIYTISIFHIIALILIFSFSLYIFFRARKTPLLYSYLTVVSMIVLWMLSKLLKTVAPSIELRWFFIVTQYFGVDFLGVSLVVFAYIYTTEEVPSVKKLVLWTVLPVLSFLIVLSNPIHMGFYSYFDFYKDRFGPLFYPTQIIQYTYLLIGIIMLSHNFTKQYSFRRKKGFGVFFAAISLLPLIANFYYILFKLNVLSWWLPFPVFDFTPIAGSVALIIFMIPALTFRFFDMSPVSYGRLFEIMPQGIVFMNNKRVLYGGNKAFYEMFTLKANTIGLNAFIHNKLDLNESEHNDFLSFISADQSVGLELKLQNGKVCRITRGYHKSGNIILCFADITKTKQNFALLEQQNTELSEVNQRLDKMAEKIRVLAITKTKSRMAQNVHDILGHSLTVVIGTVELAVTDEDDDMAKAKLEQAEELLSGSLNDLRGSFSGGEYKSGQTSLTSAIEHLKNENIRVDFIVHGSVFELKGAITEAIFRLCQEAVTNAIKHGKAESIHIILRYKPRLVEVFVVDNGLGCGEIVKNYGLRGIEERFSALSGSVEFGSDGEKGFSIHGIIPI